MIIILGTVWGFVPKKPDPSPFAVQVQTIDNDKVDCKFPGEIWGQIRNQRGLHLEIPTRFLSGKSIEVGHDLFPPKYYM